MSARPGPVALTCPHVILTVDLKLENSTNGKEMDDVVKNESVGLAVLSRYESLTSEGLGMEANS